MTRIISSLVKHVTAFFRGKGSNFFLREMKKTFFVEQTMFFWEAISDGRTVDYFWMKPNLTLPRPGIEPQTSPAAKFYRFKCHSAKAPFVKTRETKAPIGKEVLERVAFLDPREDKFCIKSSFFPSINSSDLPCFSFKYGFILKFKTLPNCLFLFRWA